MELNYKKNKNEKLFKEMIDPNLLNIEDPQNYIPIYDRFFNFSETNYNSINLNNVYKLNSIDEKLGYSKFKGTIIDSCHNSIEKKIFFKYSPLYDPTKYMIGRFEDVSYNIYNLPKFNNKQSCDNDNKIYDPNNSAYTDGFFSYLSSLLLNHYNFLNGLDYYGSFLALKNNFVVEINDDLEFLDDSDFFHKNLNELFSLVENEKYNKLFSNTKKNRQKLIIDETQNNENLDLDILNLDILDLDTLDLNNSTNEDNKEDSLSLEYESFEKVENEDINENKKQKKNRTNDNSDSGSSCSSRSSITNDEDSNEEDEEESEEESEEDESSSSEEEEIYANINKFPVQTIAMECCEDTLDSYIVNNKIKDDEWESIVLQILFTLITYQKIFDFTHNDLHTNNIVYVSTQKKYLYYKYDNKHYKVPTFGKIYKIIDFGRAIYRFKGELICSDSYAETGDANSQYNCEPYFNSNKPRLEPNYSFDLCRLGCSLFDYFIEDIEDIKKLKSPIKKIMITWVFDDNNKNILYKNNGDERYPDFKLYKMIARIVHNHTPQKVLKNALFEKYTITKKKINNIAAIFSIDDLPIMTN